MTNPATAMLGPLHNHGQAHIIHKAARTKTGQSLMEIFNKHSGVLEFRPTGEANVLAFYRPSPFFNDGSSIIIGPFARDSSVIHELRHHQQFAQMGIGKIRGLRDRCLTGSWSEADARAVEFLHALEKIESERNAQNRPHVIESFVNGTYPYNYTARSTTTDRLYKHYCIDQKPALTPAEKKQFMRDVFDDYLSRTNHIHDFYRTEQLDRIQRTRPLSLTVPAVFLPFIAIDLISTGGNILDPMVMLLTTQSATILGMRQYFAAAHCKNSRTLDESTEKLKIFGTMPYGTGNYLTETKGRPLTDDFYHRLPKQLEEAIAIKSAQMHAAAHPLSALKDKCVALSKNIFKPS